MFQGEINGILEDVPIEKVTVIGADASVHEVIDYSSEDYPISIQVSGGGGTDFEPAFQVIDTFETAPDAIIYLTDMYGNFPSKEPGYPVLWASTSGIDKAPFGQVIQIRE